MNAMNDLRHQVQDALLDDEHIRDFGIDVLDSNGIITLRGTVPTHEDRDLAEAIVREVSDLTSVINEIDLV